MSANAMGYMMLVIAICVIRYCNNAGRRNKASFARKKSAPTGHRGCSSASAYDEDERD